MNCRSARFPSLHHSKEGWLRHKSNGAKPPLLAQTGWFSLRVSIGKPPRPRGQRRLRDILLIARPPLLAVMQGGEFCRISLPDSNSFPPSITAYSLKLGPAGHARKRHHIADICHPGDVHQCPLKPQSKAGVRYAAVFPDIEIPFVVLDIPDSHFSHSSDQHVAALLALAAANDFSDFWNE